MKKVVEVALASALCVSGAMAQNSQLSNTNAPVINPTSMVSEFSAETVGPVLSELGVTWQANQADNGQPYIDANFAGVMNFRLIPAACTQSGFQRCIGLSMIAGFTGQANSQTVRAFNYRYAFASAGLDPSGDAYLSRYEISDYGMPRGNLATSVLVFVQQAALLADELASARQTVSLEGYADDLAASRLNLLRLLSEIQSPNCDFERVKEIVAQDVTLSYKLLRHINSALYGMPRRVESIKETVVYLGLNAVKNLACLFLLSDSSDMPHDLIVTAMLRAKMCELLAQANGVRDSQPFFTSGLFSILDAMTNSTMENVLVKLPLGDDLREALLERTGEIGEVLECTLAYERGEWSRVAYANLSRAQIKRAFLEAVAWVERVDKELDAMAA